MNNFTIKETPIKDLVIIEPKVFGDERGFFQETYNKESFAELGFNMEFVQDNHSLSQKGVLRGLHYQLNPYAQGKLVRVVQGRAWDVAVDIRQNSPTFGQWVGVELTSENHRQFWIPEGFAHGFIALEDNTQFLYKTTNYYNKESEGAIIWNDPEVAIEWPLSEIEEVLVSDKDKLASTLNNADVF